MRRRFALRDQLVFEVQVSEHLGLRLRGVDAEVEQVDHVAFVDHAIAATRGIKSLLHARHDVIAALFALVILFGDLFLADLLQQLLVLVGEEVHLADRAVDVVLRPLEMTLQFEDFNLQKLNVQRISRGSKLCLFLFEFYLLLAHVDIRFLQGCARAVDLGQRVLDGADRRDGRHVQSHLHELAVALVEVAGVPNDGWHPLLDVGQHRRVFRLCGRQSRCHVRKYDVVHYLALLMNDAVIGLRGR